MQRHWHRCWQQVLLLAVALPALCQALHQQQLQGSAKAPASHLPIWLTGNVFWRWRHASGWHHAPQNQNLSTSLQGFFSFPLGMEKCKKKAHECHQGLSAKKEYLSFQRSSTQFSAWIYCVPADTGWKAENKHPIKANHSTALASPIKGRTKKNHQYVN